MNRKEFVKLLTEKVLLLDGSYGANFFKMGKGDIPGELLNLKDPDTVLKLQRDYVKSGADILLSNTFSANKAKLLELKASEDIEAINHEGVRIAKEASAGRALVFADMTSTGSFPTPVGDSGFEEIYEIYREQAQYLFDAGADGFIVETMTDMKELKAAVLAIRSVTEDLPLIAHMTFDETMRSVTGTTVEIFGSLFNDLDVDVVGINCSLDPEGTLKVLERLSKYTSKPLCVEPNAGKPVYDGKRLTYNMTPEKFAVYVEDFIDIGASIIGGCCGTSPEHIALARKQLDKRLLYKNTPGFKRASNMLNYLNGGILEEASCGQVLSSRTKCANVLPFTVIGERINPASRNKFQAEIQECKFDRLYHEAQEQEIEGAKIIDVNLGIEKTLDHEHFRKAINGLDRISSIPISFDIQVNRYLDTALREYAGRGLINSARVTEKSLANKIALLKKYGGMLILLAMGKEISESAEERFKKVMEGIEILEKNGISRNRVFADPLVLSMGAKNDPYITLQTVSLLSREGIKTTMGLSNLSFGLPDRSAINSAFLAQCMYFGQTSAIMNPGENIMMDTVKGSLLLKGEKLEEGEKIQSENPFTDSLLNGDIKKLELLTEEALNEYDSIHVSQNILGKAMEEIGTLYSKGKIFLPNLLLASETSQPIFSKLNKLNANSITFKGKVLLATVEGDVHDIGKKIVGTVLKSGGFEVIDAGKDIPASEIVKRVKEIKPDILGLSAMMTTTVGRVEEVHDLLKAEGMEVLLISGGASMTEELAQNFGCDGYSKDASQALILCKNLMDSLNA